MTVSPPAAWYPDPQTPASLLRYWDGTKWTEHSAPAVAPAIPSLDPAAPTPKSAAATTPLASEHESKHHGIFRPSKSDLQAEIARLTAENNQQSDLIARIGAVDAASVLDFTKRKRQELDQVQSQLAQATSQLAALQAQIVVTDEIAVLQEVGVYQYSHPLDDAVAYSSRLQDIKNQIKAMVSSGTAVEATKNWTVNGSTAQGGKMVRDFSKLMLRAYNAEADNSVRSMKPHKLATAADRLTKVRETIARLGKTMDIRISDTYHAVRLQELQLTADYLAKAEEEKERTRAAREQQRQEDLARREYEREKARLEKEHSHYSSALDRLQTSGDLAGATELQAKLDEIASAIAGVDERAANIRAGYVYVISNIGSFGEHMVKIGMTRRLDPMDRIRELGDASVPFRFDVHALFFSDDAVALETALHQRLEDRRVNRVNARREFFYATASEVRDELLSVAGQHILEYRDNVEALEWRASGSRVPGASILDQSPS